MIPQSRNLLRQKHCFASGYFWLFRINFAGISPAARLDTVLR
jgi:hypothetical protein